MKIKNLFSILLLTTALFFVSCEEDDHIPPTVSFKTGGNYTSADATVTKGSSVTVGITADKKEDDMKTYNISYAYDGATTTSSKETFTLTTAEAVHYEKDYTFTVRNSAGTEEWFFVITDKDGNIAKLSLKLTVN